MKSVNQDSKNKIKSIVLLTLAFLLAAVVGATFAYFRAQVGEGANVNINASSGTTDSLMFTKGKDINITASQDDFKEGGDNKEDESTVTATLIPNDKTNEAHRTYNVYFVIDNNDFIYTTKEEKKPEIILQVINPKNEPVTTIPGLTYVTVEQDGKNIEGFDITTRKAHAFEIAKDYAIDATNGKVDQQWQIKVILINLKTNQNENGGKTFHGSVQITTDTKETYTLAENNTMTAPSKSYNSITVESTVIPGTIPIDKYYFAIEETTDEETIGLMSIAEKLALTYHESDKNTYTFTSTEDGKELKENQAYKIYSYAIDEEGIQSNIHSEVIKTDKYKQVEVTGEVSDITSTSMKLTLTANDETSDGKVDKYYFRKDEEENWVESETNSYVFQGLEPGQDYTLYGKVVDTKGKDSNTWEDQETTLNLYKVNVEVTNGNSEPKELNVEEGKDAAFKISANEGYDLTKASATPDNCKIDTEGNLTVSQVTSHISCTVNIPSAKKTMNDVCPSGGTLTECLTQLGNDPKRYVGDGELLHHTIDLDNSAGDDGYRYSGNNPNNFICFGPGSKDYNNGSPDATCELKNQYRIIGIVPVTKADGTSDTLIKVIKSEYLKDNDLNGLTTSSLSIYSSYISIARVQTKDNLVGFQWNESSNQWTDGNYNYWSKEDEEEIKVATLNKSLNDGENGYLSKLKNDSEGIDWTKKIELVQWNVGGVDSNEYTPSQIKEKEESMETEGQGGKITSIAKIGLMYVHDYGFASTKDNWTTNLKSYNTTGNQNGNWLFNGVYEWTISRGSGNSYHAFLVARHGNANDVDVSNFSSGVRPVFYLTSDIKLKADSTKDGSVDKPFRIEI